MDRRRLGLILLVGLPSLLAATVAVAVLQGLVGVANASAVYLVAVVVTAYVTGTLGAVLVAVGSFLLYNFLFTEPRFTLTIHDPGVLLSVVLLLFVGIVVGQLAAVQRSRAETAREREQEARALFKVSRALATRETTLAVLPELAAIVAGEARLDRVWLALGTDEAVEQVVADTAPGGARALPAVIGVLKRMPGDQPAQWLRIHQPASGPRAPSGAAGYRVRIEAGSATMGSIWALRQAALGPPTPSETRLLAATADQIGQALDHDRLAAESQAAEVARQSDRLKSALLQSVSHDLRTPLATIRAAAGTLRPGTGLTVEDQEASAEAIEREVEYLDRLVTNLLDLSRIEAGALRVHADAFEVDDLLGPTLERFRGALSDRTVEIDLATSPVLVDPVLLDEAFANLVENAVKYTHPGSFIRFSAAAIGEDRVRVTVEDSGPGVPAEALPRLFEKFYRVPGRETGKRSGTGIGLAVVRGLVEAMGGRVRARPSDLGGLAIDLELPAAEMPAELSGPGLLPDAESAG